MRGGKALCLFSPRKAGAIPPAEASAFIDARSGRRSPARNIGVCPEGMRHACEPEPLPPVHRRAESVRSRVCLPAVRTKISQPGPFGSTKPQRRPASSLFQPALSRIRQRGMICARRRGRQPCPGSSPGRRIGRYHSENSRHPGFDPVRAFLPALRLIKPVGQKDRANRGCPARSERTSIRVSTASPAFHERYSPRWHRSVRPRPAG